MLRDLAKYQADYLKQPFERYQAAFRKRKIIEELRKYKHANILEIGCGLESIFLSFADFERLTVVEPGQVFHKKASEDRDKFPEKQIVLIDAFLEDCIEDIQKQFYDFIIVASLLHELPRPASFLRMLYSLAWADTVIHVNVPNARSLHRILAFESGLISDIYQQSSSNQEFQQHSVFDIEQLRQMVVQAGFTILESGSFFIKPLSHKQMGDMLEKGIITEKVLEGLYTLSERLPKFGSEIFVNLRK